MKVSKYCYSMLFLFLFYFQSCYSPNGPVTNEDKTIDTLTIVNLDSEVSVPFEIYVCEYKNYVEKVFVDSAIIELNGKIIGYTDSLGYAESVFGINQIPFKYCFKIQKDGYKSFEGCNWSSDSTIVHLGVAIEPL